MYTALVIADISPPMYILTVSLDVNKNKKPPLPLSLSFSLSFAPPFDPSFPQFMQALSDIQIAMKVLDDGKKHAEEVHPVDRHYKGLQCQLTPVKHEDKLFGLIEKYVKQTHAKTHNQYRMEVTDVFAVERNREKEAFNDVGNRYAGL